MPAAPQQSGLKRLGIVAGGGDLPVALLEACDRQGIEPFIVAFEGQTNPEILKDRNYMLTRLGAAGRIINVLKSHGIRDLVLIGTMRRPSLAELRPDLRTLGFFSKMVTHAIGDDGLLKAVRGELEQEGFRIHAVQEFIHDLLAAEGAYSAAVPDELFKKDIDRALRVLKTIGPLDIGQALVIQGGHVLGVEAAEGTDELIGRCGALKRDGPGPVLVKISKPGQDRALDLPTVGPETLRQAAAQGFAGIVIEAGSTLLIDPQAVAEAADQAGMFFVAVRA